MDISKYLKRINSGTLTEVSLENLKKLQRNHLKALPFENLDIHLGKHVDLSLEEIYNKVIYNQRGGYCFELNLLFGWLLNELGYECYYVPAKVFITSIQKYLNHNLHLILVVVLDKRQYYVDVASARLMNRPIEIVVNQPNIQDFAVFQFRKEESNDTYLLEMCVKKDFKDGNIKWTPQVKFQIEPQKLEFFKELNDLVQQREHSTMPYKNIVTRQDDGCVFILVGFKYSEIVYNGDEEQRTDRIVTKEEAIKLLGEKFNIVVDESFSPKDEPLPNIFF